MGCAGVEESRRQYESQSTPWREIVYHIEQVCRHGVSQKPMREALEQLPEDSTPLVARGAGYRTQLRLQRDKETKR